MPIKGISDVRRLPRIGKVRLGMKDISKRTQREYPKAVDYFVVRDDDGITFKAAADSFHQVYGEKPKALDIMFPLNDPEVFFQQWYKRYGSGTGLICKGDGEVASEVNRHTGEMIEQECNPSECEWIGKKHCKAIGTLMFLLPMVAGVGCWQLDTGSWNSIVNLNSAIDFIKRLTDGRIAMLPLTLALRPKDVQPEGKKKTVWVLDLALEGVSMERLLKPPDLKTLYLPPDTSDQIPDDLYPASMQGENKTTEAKRPKKAVEKVSPPPPEPTPDEPYDTPSNLPIDEWEKMLQAEFPQAEVQEVKGKPASYEPTGNEIRDMLITLKGIADEAGIGNDAYDAITEKHLSLPYTRGKFTQTRRAIEQWAAEARSQEGEAGE